MRAFNLGAVRRALYASAVLTLFAAPSVAQVVEKGRTFADLTASHPCDTGLTNRIARVTDCDAADDIGDGEGAFQCWAICDGSAPWVAQAIGGGAGGAGVSGLDTADGGTALADNAVVRGDGTTGIQGSAVTVADSTGNLQWEGTTDDAFEGNFTFADPTADWTWAWGATGGVTVPGSIFAPTTGFNHATTPAYSFAGDPDTGIYNDSANNTIKFATEGSRRAYIGSVAFALDAGVVLYLDTLVYLTPAASPPIACNGGNEGYIYTDTSHALCWCDGTIYQKLSGAGTCA